MGSSHVVVLLLLVLLKVVGYFHVLLLTLALHMLL